LKHHQEHREKPIYLRISAPNVSNLSRFQRNLPIYELYPPAIEFFHAILKSQIKIKFPTSPGTLPQSRLILTVIEFIPASFHSSQLLFDQLLINIASRQEGFTQRFEILEFTRVLPHVVTE